jgi:hypothetical protein
MRDARGDSPLVRVGDHSQHDKECMHWHVTRGLRTGDSELVLAGSTGGLAKTLESPASTTKSLMSPWLDTTTTTNAPVSWLGLHPNSASHSGRVHRDAS